MTTDRDKKPARGPPFAHSGLHPGAATRTGARINASLGIQVEPPIDTAVHKVGSKESAFRLSGPPGLFSHFSIRVASEELRGAPRIPRHTGKRDGRRRALPSTGAA